MKSRRLLAIVNAQVVTHACGLVNSSGIAKAPTLRGPAGCVQVRWTPHDVWKEVAHRISTSHICGTQPAPLFGGAGTNAYLLGLGGRFAR